jgi:SRSO17 transposase
MDVELQIFKHLPRDAQKTVSLIDEYCSYYQELFPEVRSYECFKYLHLGIISPIARKSLPEIAQVVGINSAQSLHHFLARSPWSVRELRKRRLERTLSALRGQKITVVIDETGDRKKGKKTDYVARQYLGSIGKVDRGIVSVNAYGIYQNITFPLSFKIYQPKATVPDEDKYQTKIELANKIIDELIDFGFNIELVLADSLYGESSLFVSKLREHKLTYVVAIRSNHGVWMPSGQTVRANKWQKFERIFSNQTSETRYVREIIFGKKHQRTYWEITTDPETMPKNSTSFVMTNLSGKTSQIKQTLGNLYGLRTWVEYGFRQVKQELGWTDYRFTKFEQIEKWWELIFSAYLMVSLTTLPGVELNPSELDSHREKSPENCSRHQHWNHDNGWKNALNNLRLLVQPTLALWLLSPWLEIFPNRNLLLGFHDLIRATAQVLPYYNSG